MHLLLVVWTVFAEFSNSFNFLRKNLSNFRKNLNQFKRAFLSKLGIVINLGSGGSFIFLVQLQRTKKNEGNILEMGRQIPGLELRSILNSLKEPLYMASHKFEFGSLFRTTCKHKAKIRTI